MKRKIFSILFTLVLVLSLSLVMAAPVAAATPIYVNGTTGSDTNNGETPGTAVATIAKGIQLVDIGGTVNVAAGTYNEQVVIDKSLTLQGVGDTTIIQPSGASILTTVKTTPWIGGGSKQMAAIVFVDTAGAQVTIKDLKIDGSGITGVPAGVGSDWVAGLAYLETSGTIESLTVIGNPGLACRTCGIWASAVSSVAQVEVTGCSVIGYNRAGIYALGETMTADYHHNEINGPGAIISQVPNGMFFLRGATGSATYNTVTDLGYTGEEYRSTGIGTYDAGTGITFGHNTISNVQNAFCLNRGSDVTVEYNDVYDCHTGVRLESSTANNIIRGNDILNNTYAIRCSPSGGDNEAHFNNFVGNTGTDAGFPTYVGAVSSVDTTRTLDATNNWWGDASGPGPVGPGTGDAVSNNVDYDPWLGAEIAAAKTGTTPPETFDACTEADCELIVDGDAIVTVACYCDNPGTGFSGDIGKYIDVHIEPTNGVTEIEIRLYYTDDEIEGLNELSLKLYWWDSSDWTECSDSGVNTADTSSYSGYIWAKIRDDTTPDLDDLTGTPIGGGGSPRIVGGTVYPVNKLSILMPWIGLAVALALAGVFVARLARRKVRS